MYGIKPSKKSLLYLGVILVIALLVSAGLLYYFLQKNYQIKKLEIEIQQMKATQESIIKSLSAPQEITKSVSIEVLNNLSTPPKKPAQAKTSEDVIKSLSAPAQK